LGIVNRVRVRGREYGLVNKDQRVGIKG